jgi:hypothetical protein
LMKLELRLTLILGGMMEKRNNAKGWK